MTNFKKQAFAALTTIALLANVTGSAFAATTTLEVSGNGRNSTSDVTLNNNSTTSVVQNNVASVDNTIKVNSNTGGNKANDNSGDVMIKSGDAGTRVDVSNDLNHNVAKVDCCATGNTDVKVSGNLRDSDNTVNLNQNNTKGIFQTNVAAVNNNVDVNAKTGNNQANDNLGGSVDVKSGDATTIVNLKTDANTNAAVMGGPSVGANGGVSAMIVGNGRNSDNDINLSMNRNVDLLQTNYASVMNDVDVDANTGHNKANDNSGDVMIRSGEATTLVGIDNSVNFNVAALDCGCLLGDVHSKIANNLRDSDNAITASLDDSKAVFQTNVSDLHNNADVDAKTGDNKANDNLGGIYVDPYLKSGDATSVFDVKNAGNENTYGTSFVMPGTGSHVELSWNWASMMAYFGMSM